MEHYHYPCVSEEMIEKDLREVAAYFNCTVEELEELRSLPTPVQVES